MKNSAIHVPLIIAIFDPPLVCRAHATGNTSSNIKTYHYVVVYKRMLAFRARFANAFV
jgi:hypothetical protein